MIQGLLFLIVFPLILSAHEATFPWVVYYNDQAKPEEFEAFNPIILDSQHHPELEPILKTKKEVLGYLNLTEAEDRQPWFQSVKDKGLLIKSNHIWAGGWAVDIRDPFWKDLLVSKIIPEIFAKGFTGLFFDQIDIPIALEKEDPIKYKGMTAAAVDLVQTICKKFAPKRFMLNRGYEILPEVGNVIDFELAETLYSSFDFETKTYYVRPEKEFEWQLEQLNQARKMFPHLVIFSLDYWDPEDTEMIKKIYAIERENCLRAYVTSPDLGTITRE